MDGQSKFETEFRREEKFWRDCSEKLSEVEYAAKMAEFLGGEEFGQDIIEDIIDDKKAKTELPEQFEACFREQKLFWKKCKRTLKVRTGKPRVTSQIPFSFSCFFLLVLWPGS